VCTVVNTDDTLRQCPICENERDHDLERALALSTHDKVRSQSPDDIAVALALSTLESVEDTDRIVLDDISFAMSLQMEEADRYSQFLTDERIASAIQGEDSENSDLKWTCERCSYINSTSHSSCSMCESSRTNSNTAPLIQDDPRYVDAFSGIEFAYLLGEFNAAANIPQHKSQGKPSSEKSISNMARTINRKVASKGNKNTPMVNLRNLASHSENVHNAAVEQVAIESIDELVNRPLLDGQSIDSVIEEAKALLMYQPAGLPMEIALKAIEELNDQNTLQCRFKGKSFRVVFAAVWNIASRHKDRAEIMRRVAEEVAEGADQCNGGKIGRLVNSLRGFINIGNQLTETGTGEAFQNAFSARVLRMGLSDEERRNEAVVVLDEYGITGKVRDDWLESVAML